MTDSSATLVIARSNWCLFCFERRNLGCVALCSIAQNENSTIFAGETEAESFESHSVPSEPYLPPMHFRCLFAICFDFASVYTC